MFLFVEPRMPHPLKRSASGRHYIKPGCQTLRRGPLKNLIRVPHIGINLLIGFPTSLYDAINLQQSPRRMGLG